MQGALVEKDVFDDEVADPAESRAIESSLWEVETLKRHYKYALVGIVCMDTTVPV